VQIICRISLPVVERLNPNDGCIVPDKPLSQEECDFIGMPKGFNGSMYAFSKHDSQYTPRESKPSSKYRKYAGTNDLQPGLATMAKVSILPTFASLSLGNNYNSTFSL